MKVWGVFNHIECYIDGDREIIEDLMCLYATKELAIKRIEELEEPQIKELMDEGLSRNETKIYFFGYSCSEINVIG